MGAKKKPESSSKKEAGDESTEKLYKSYRRHLLEFAIAMPRPLEEQFSEIRDEKNPGRLTEIALWEEVSVSGVRAIADALRETQYQFVRTLRFWKANTEDEGVRAIVQFMRACPTVLHLEFLECAVTALGCEFLGDFLAPAQSAPLQILRLDHNALGDSGISHLALGLRMNSVLTELSLSYCGITEGGARWIMEILINQTSALQLLNVQGNALIDVGASLVFRALRVNTALKRLGIADNQFTEEAIQEFLEVLRYNRTLVSVDARYNGVYDTGATAICEALKAERGAALSELQLSPNKVSPSVLSELEKLLSGNKRGKKGKRGKKK